MIKKKKMKVVFAAFAGVMLFGGLAFSPNKSQAAKKVSITKSVKVYEGKTAKIKLSNNKKKVTWSVTKGSGNIGLSKKSKMSVTVTGCKVGKATVQAKAGGKKYVCSVTVSKAVADADAKKGILTKKNMEYWGVKNSGNIVIPNGVKKIGNEVFAETKIGSIKLPKSLKSIGEYAFAFSSIQSITIPNTVNTIGEGVFSWCQQLKQVKLPNKLKKLEEATFCGCTALTDITIPNTVTSLGNECFLACDVLTDITIPNTVTSLGEKCFNHCDKLKSIKLPSGLKKLNDETFEWCSSLTDITIPDGVTSIGESCFYGCEALTDITIPDGLTYVGHEFENGKENAGDAIDTYYTKITWRGKTYNDFFDFFYDVEFNNTSV